MGSTLPLATRIVLVRHGHTAGNRDGGRLMSGQVPIRLTAHGRRQAAALARAPRLACEEVSALYSSPLRRAADTARTIARTRHLQVRLLEDLMELDCGEVDGLPVGEVERRFPELWARNLLQHDDAFRWPGGESYAELRYRALRAMNRMAREHSGGCVLAVTHAGVVSQIVGFLRGTPPARWECWRPANASLTVVCWGPGDASGKVEVFDDHQALESSEVAPT